MTDFQNSFTVGIRRKFVVTLSLKIPSHRIYVDTLPCEMSHIALRGSLSQHQEVFVLSHRNSVCPDFDC